MNIDAIYPKCRSLLEIDLWRGLTDFPELDLNPEQFPQILERNKGGQVPEFLPNLAQIELALYQMRSKPDLIPEEVTQLTINPTLNIIELTWKNLANMFHSSDVSGTKSEHGDEMLLIWRNPESEKEIIEPAANEELLVLKMAVEEIPAETIAASAKAPAQRTAAPAPPPRFQG